METAIYFMRKCELSSHICAHWSDSCVTWQEYTWQWNWLSAHLHHQNDGVQSNHGHNKVLEGTRDHEFPDAVLDRIFVLWHVAAQWPGIDGKIDALFLQKQNNL